MTRLDSTSGVSVSSGRRSKGDKNAANDDKNATTVSDMARNGRRSAFAAFGDVDCKSAESPARKKQNTSTSIAHRPAPETRIDTSGVSGTPVEYDSQNALKNNPRSFDVGLVNSPADDKIVLPRLSIEKENGKAFDHVPPAKKIPTLTTAVTTTPNIKDADKITAVENKARGTMDVDYNNPNNTKVDVPGTNYSSSKRIESRNDRVSHGRGYLNWIGIFTFNTFVIAGMIWSGLLLNEHTMYKLKSMECTNRLHQAYQAMDLTSEFKSLHDPNGESNIIDRFEEHEFYWKELEAQVRYWKKEAKKYQRYGDGFRVQCQEDLEHLLSESHPQNIDSR